MSAYLKNLKSDLPSSLVVFLIAIPLCLGIAVGSGVPPFAGLIAGVVGGIVVGGISNSQLSVSGPAAGLISTVALILEKVPVYEALLLSIVLAGVMQIIFGLLKSGTLVNYVPVSVIKGMMAAIGLLLILKQFPHLVGFDRDFEGDDSFIQADGQNTFSEIVLALKQFTPLAIVIGLLGLAIQVFWDSRFFPLKKYRYLFPAPLIVVVVGVVINEWMKNSGEAMAIKPEHMVSIPSLSSVSEFSSAIRTPDFGFIGRGMTWVFALQIAIIASIESLLSIEASDKMDIQRRSTNTNRELIAQGTGNVVSGLLGGLPITSVIVRSSVNATSGAKTKMSAILHGVLIMASLMVFPFLLNSIPLTALASILMYTGYKLAKPSIFREMYSRGKTVFLPFVVTIAAILVSDLLVGILIGFLVGVYFIIRSNSMESVKTAENGKNYLIKFGTHVSFLNKSILKNELSRLSSGDVVYFDLSKTHFLDHDIIDILDDFNVYARNEGIQLDYKFASEKQQLRFKPIENGISHQAAAQQQVVGGEQTAR